MVRGPSILQHSITLYLPEEELVHKLIRDISPLFILIDLFVQKNYSSTRHTAPSQPPIILNYIFFYLMGESKSDSSVLAAVAGRLA